MIKSIDVGYARACVRVGVCGERQRERERERERGRERGREGERD